jgi:Circadian oscillating protein COP23
MMMPQLKTILTMAIVSSFLTIPLGRVSLAEEKPTARFSCGQSRVLTTDKKIPTTFALTKRGSVPVIRWQSTYFGKSSIYTPLKRCEEVSRRFQKYYSEGTLSYLTTGKMNAQNVICVSDEYGGPCQGLLLTLEPKDNPQAVLKDLLSARNRASGPLTRSTGSLYVDMTNFLETTPVEEDVSLNPSSKVLTPNPKAITPKPSLIKPKSAPSVPN